MTTIHKRGRTVLAGLALAAASLTATLPLAPAATASAKDGLYGVQDPTYDGVFRQSLSLLAFDAAGREPADTAVRWLTDRQCDDGGWTAYREDPSQPCDAKTEDTNSTAMAVQALAALGGHDEAVSRAMDWLESQRNPDGGVGYQPGMPSDANSTGLLVNAAVAAGDDPATMAGSKGKTPLDGLLALQVGCKAPEDQRGAFAFQPDKSGAMVANDSATAAAALALAGATLPVTKATTDVGSTALTCPDGSATPEDAGAAAGAYLTQRLDANDGTIPPMQGDQPDYATTANAALALAALGDGQNAASAAQSLTGAVDAFVKDESGADRPAALATLVLVAEATGDDPATFGGEDLVSRLEATGPAAPPASAEQDAEADDEDFSWPAAVGAGLAAAAALAVGMVFLRRRR